MLSQLRAFCISHYAFELYKRISCRGGASVVGTGALLTLEVAFLVSPWVRSAQTLLVRLAMLGICTGVCGFFNTSDLSVFEHCMI